MRYKIALVDDHSKTLHHLKNELGALDTIDVIFTAANGEDYLQQMKKLPYDQHPQAVIMDIDMPIVNGIDAVKQSRQLYENVEYVMFTITDDDDKLFDAIQAGANGYLLKDEPISAICDAIQQVIEKSGAPMSPSIARKTLKLLTRTSDAKEDKSLETDLSEREIEILKSVVAGLNYKQIAEKIFISPFTVRNHIRNIYTKLHITSKAQAVKLAVKNKWV